MSSSNLVSVTYQAEDEGYGVKMPADAGSLMYTARFTDESLSGTPETTTSTELRTDRMSAGQVVVGLEVGGAINWELSADKFHDDFIEAGMMSTWVPAETVSTTVTLEPVTTQSATLTLADEFANLVPGVFCVFTPASGDQVVVQITSVDTPATVFTVATRVNQAAVTGEAIDASLPAYVDIGAEAKSFLIGKAYQDVTHLETTDEHSQTYLGSLVSGFTVNATVGEIINGTYETVANGYEQEVGPSYQQQVITAGGTVTPAGTSNPINPSVDMELVTVNNVATDYCTMAFSLALDNGLTPQQCIGRIAPRSYDLGTAEVTVNTSIYLSDTSYDNFMPDKMTQNPIAMSFVAQNDSGGYCYALTAVQLSFPDPAATGQNQSTMIEAAGVGKVGDGGASTLRVYKL